MLPEHTRTVACAGHLGFNIWIASKEIFRFFIEKAHEFGLKVLEVSKNESEFACALHTLNGFVGTLLGLMGKWLDEV